MNLKLFPVCRSFLECLKSLKNPPPGPWFFQYWASLDNWLINLPITLKTYLDQVQDILRRRFLCFKIQVFTWVTQIRHRTTTTHLTTQSSLTQEAAEVVPTSTFGRNIQEIRSLCSKSIHSGVPMENLTSSLSGPDCQGKHK